jgi:threonine dehydrogenase-like Zn-dependent dehydrogenase
MRATVMYGAGDVRIENVAGACLIEPTDALVSVSRAAVCGGDLWPYNQMEPSERPAASWDTRPSASSKPSAATSAP